MKVIKYEIPESGKSYKPKAPFIAKVISNTRLTEAASSDDTRNVIFDIRKSGIEYIEGQSIGIIPPGERQPGKAHKARLYSIASSRKGDDGNSTQITLCVKRVLFDDPESGEEVRGIASNYICDLQPEEEVPIIGPTGRRFLLPADHSTDLIMVAVGTGIAPFRAFVKRIYEEVQDWNGKVRLFHGSRTGMESLYMNRENDDMSLYMTQETFQAFRALSDDFRSEDNEKGDTKKGWVQNQIEDNIEEIWQMICKGKFSFYLCGMKALEEGVLDVFQKRAERDGLNWEEMLKEFHSQGRWNVEVY